MAAEERILQRIGLLIAKGQSVLQTHTPNAPGVIGFPTLETGPFNEWRSQSLVALRDIVGDGHTYTTEFDKRTEKGGYQSVVQAGLGILRSLKEDVEQGYMISLKTLVVAEVFSDFLEMAKHLIEQGYAHPAASLTGAVLEDGLRRVAASRSISVKAKDDLSTLNQKCSQANVYNVLTMKKINEWIHIRNQADHGKFNEYVESDVRDMHRGVSDFLEQHLS